MKTEQDMIDEVMDNFDFESVQKMMAAVDWRWGNEEGGDSVPDVADLRQSARRMIKDTFKEGVFAISSGGFQVERGEDYIRLSWGPEYIAYQEDEL